jgi:hypothetical protein
MLKQNSSTETVDFRFVVTDKTNSARILAAKWLRSHKTEVLDFLSRGFKYEIAGDNDATLNQIHGAKIESAAFFRYMAEALGAQIAIERDDQPAIALPPPIAPALSDQSSSASGADDDWDADDGDLTVSGPMGGQL